MIYVGARFHLTQINQNGLFLAYMRTCNGIRNRNTKIVVTTVITAVMLLGATVISTMSTTQNVFAYRNSQATAQANVCGNLLTPLNIGCQNIDSKIQGDRNAVALSAEQRFPSPLPTCVECFTNFLTTDEIEVFEQALVFGTVEGTCTFLEDSGLTPEELQVEFSAYRDVLTTIGVDPSRVEQIIDCLEEVFGIPAN
jgi:hypothetical protein